MTTTADPYRVLGDGYAHVRRPDPRIARRLHTALGDATTVVNVGAGTGSYELTDLRVLAIEPSATMLRNDHRDQRLHCKRPRKHFRAAMTSSMWDWPC